MASDILQKPVASTLIAMTAPAAFGMLVTFLFQLVDTYFIGQLGTKELAAISFSYPIYLFIASFFMGIAAGVSSTVAKALGEGDPLKAQSLMGLSVLFFMLLTAILGLIGYFNIQPVFSLLGAKSNTLPLISQYMQTLYIGMFTLVGALIANAALMAKGIMLKTTIIMSIGGVVNLILDYVLIFGLGPIPAMALKGAALATVISWCVILLLMTLLLYKEKLVSFSAIKSVKQAWHYITEVIRISVPAIVAQVLNPLTIAVITRIVSLSGENAVAAFGIVARIESLALTGILALSIILIPFAAQNFGAKQHDRLKQAMATSGRMTVCWGFLFYGLMLVFATHFVAVFTDNSHIISYSRQYLTIVGFSWPAYGLALITMSFFNGVQQPRDSLKLALIKSLGLTIPLALAGSLISLDGVWMGLLLANVIGAVYAGRLLNRWRLKMEISNLPSTMLRDVHRITSVHVPNT
jgi:MATE family, multidrug efflux pump